MSELVELEIEPGLFTENSERGSVGRWKDGDKVRFRYGQPEKMRGWVDYTELEPPPP